MINKEQAQQQIAELTERFAEQITSYKKNDYNETLTRQDFINPFFKALGWDVDNAQGNAEAYREVIHEDRVKVGNATKAPDYSFRLPGGKRLFFVEAKKPSVAVKDEILPAYQVRRYGWSAKLPISLITDFEEFAVYDCTKKPNPTDKASTARIKYLTYKDYLSEFDFLWNTFSKERVLKGSFDKYIQSDTHKKGTATVDKEFLLALDEWRKQLALNFALRNEHLGEDELNFIVQQTIDRIIFLRIAEDRGVEPYGQLQQILKSGREEGNYYNQLFHLFNEADSKYNSGLFDFKRDTISKQASLDNKVIKTIINELYYPLSPYEFSVLSVEILGSAYEQFLGKQIKLDARHRAVIEEKPEVRKAGGVYYTPQYIVDYIVENTVGKLVANKTPDAVAKLKIADPACGSGSFLLGAYQYLLNWHLHYYKPEFIRLSDIAASKEYNNKQRTDAIKERNKLPLTPEGFLTTALKKQILLNNIYGVDIDTQAVEVTKLSLLLKCMEGETGSSINAEMRFGERVLPTLDNNIKSGNSLIDLDFYDTEFDFGEEKKIKPFSWQQAFPQVFKQGGFDCVIGNPPYIRIQSLQEFQKDSVLYFKKKYKAASTGNFDIYVLFDEKGYQLLRRNGILGFIQPHKFLQAEFAIGIRSFLEEEFAVSELVHFGSNQIFQQATTYTCLLFLKKQKNEKVLIKTVNDIHSWSTDRLFTTSYIISHPSENKSWNILDKSASNLLKKISVHNKTLFEITDKIFVGLQTSADKIYILGIKEINRTTARCWSVILGEQVEIELGLLKPFLLGKDVKRYERVEAKTMVIFPYFLREGKAEIMPSEYLQKNFPLGWEYLKRNKIALAGRENSKMNHENFYAYIYPKNLSEFEATKIMTPDIADKPNFTIDIHGQLYHTTTIYSFKFKQTIKEDKYYFLGILNSKLLLYFLRKTGNVLRGGYFRFKTEYLKPFPMRLIDFHLDSDFDKYKITIDLVKQMLSLHQQKQQTTLPEKLEQLNQRIAHTDNKINQLVYELYGLTEEEIQIVEAQH